MRGEARRGEARRGERSIQKQHIRLTQQQHNTTQLNTTQHNTTPSINNQSIKSIKSINSISSTSAYQIDEFVADTTAPILENFDIDLNTNKMTLEFDEPVKVNSFKPWGFRIQSKRSKGSHSNLPNLSNTTATASANGTNIVIDLLLSDVETIILETTLAIDRVTTFIVMDAGSFVDMEDNDVVAIVDGAAKAARSYTPDSIPPVCLGYEIDMNAGTVKLEYSEYVSIRATDVTMLSFVNDTMNTGLAHTLGESR